MILRASDSRRTIPLIATLIALVAALALQAAWADTSAQLPVTVEGRVAALASSVAGTESGPEEPPSFSMLLETEAGPLTVTLAADALVVDAEGAPVVPGGALFGARVLVTGQAVPSGHFVARQVAVLP